MSIPKELQSIPFIDLFWQWLPSNGLPSTLSGNAKLSVQADLVNSLSKFCSPTFVLEMHILGMQNKLEGDTPYERYLYFIKAFLQDPAYLSSLFAEYPVLAELIENTNRLWTKKFEEFFAHLEADRAILELQFNQGKPLGRLENLNCSLSDPHNGGKGVLGLTFESGCSFFYKPKNLGIDAAFNAFLKRLNEFDLSCPLRTYHVLNREDYGWVEKIEHLSCLEHAQVERYYTRCGMLLCLAYLFNGTDFHFENIIAEGEHPVLIDLESFFHPILNKESTINTNPKWRCSVLTTLMLPQFVLGKIGFRGLDISGLTGGQKEELFPLASPQWENVNTDEMRLIYAHNRSRESKNLVYLIEILQCAADYLQQIISGFKEMYALLLKHRELLFELDKLCSYPVRFISRPTSLYFRLLDQLTDPSFMRNREGLEEIRTILIRHLIEEKDQNLLPLVEEELKALAQRDIPFFQSYPKSLNIFSNGKIAVQNALLATAHSEALKHIDEMDETDCNLQIEFIRNAFYSRTLSKGESVYKNKSFTNPIPQLSDEALFDKAIQIGENLLARSFTTKNRGLSWIGLQHFQEDTANFSILDETFYNGTIGIALYFAALYGQTKELKWQRAAVDALGYLMHVLKSEQIERLPAAIGLGGMNGVGGIVYALSKMSLLLEDRQLLNEALHLLNYVRPEHFELDKQLDIVGGSAGLLLVLLSLPTQDLHPLAFSAAEHLIQKRDETENGTATWKTIRDYPLGGFSHGSAGFSYVFMKMALRTGNSLYRDIAKKSLAFEREIYCPNKGNWPDLRIEEKDYNNVSWCHGATGIGLSRLSLYSLTKDEQFLSEVECALQMVSKNFGERLHQACCGVAGRVEFLKNAADLLDRADLKESVRSAISQLLNEADQEGGFTLFKHLPSDAYNPGFMQGESGIGYTLLRCLDKNGQLPNVLLLD